MKKFLSKKWWPWYLGGLFVIAAIATLLTSSLWVKADTSVIEGSIRNDIIEYGSAEKSYFAFRLYNPYRSYYARVAIYNQGGRLVKKIYTSAKALPAGLYTPTDFPALYWDGKNDSGNLVDAGTYRVYFEARRTLASGPIYRDTKLITIQKSTNLSTIMSNPDTFDPDRLSAQITAMIAKDSNYKISIYDSNNTVVKNIAETRSVKSGDYTFVWDGSNTEGQKVADGSYIAKLFEITSSEQEISKASIIVKRYVYIPIVTVTATPQTFDPNGESTSIAYSIATTGLYRLAIKDSTGKVVNVISDFAQNQVANVTKVWAGKDQIGAPLNDGDYMAVLDFRQANGEISAAGSTIITLASKSDPYTGDSSEVGNTVEGTFSANYNWLSRPGYKFGITFAAPKSGRLNGINLQWKSGGSYGYGPGQFDFGHSVAQAKAEHGVYNFEVQTSGTNNFPSGTVIASKKGIYPEDGLALASGRVITDPNTEQCTCDGSLQVNFDWPAELIKDKVYHLVITNTAANPAANWSSPNTLTTRINLNSWAGGNNRAESFDGTKWTPWTTQKNLYQPNSASPSNELDGSHVPLLLRWSDSTFTGDPYYSAASQNRHPQIYGSKKMTQRIVWKGENTVIRKIGATIYKTGTPAGNLIYHVDLPDGTSKQGVLATPNQVTGRAEWVYADTSFTLEKDKTYLISFDSPNSTSAGFYNQDPVYGQGIPSIWLNNSWGGTESHAIIDGRAYLDMDLSLSLQK
jgi:flagellar hook assembly protein FlgD